MGNIEKYGVLALIFVIVLILAVAICNGPSDPGKQAPPAAPHEASSPAAGAEEIANRPLVAKKLQEQETEIAKNPGAPPAGAEAGVVLGGGRGAGESPAIDRAGFKTHTIQKGETLVAIAKKELGSSARYEEIVKANEGLDPARLKIGQAILIPLSAVAKAEGKDGGAIKPVKKSAKEGASAKTPR